MVTDADVLADIAREEAEQADPASLLALRKLGQQLVDTDVAIADTEATLARLKKEREDLRIKQLPEMMLRLKVSLIGVGNRVLSLESLISASLPKESPAREAAIDWIVDHRHGGSVTRTLTVDLPKGDAVVEHKLLAAINRAKLGVKPVVSYGIHHSTYTALCKRLVQGGEEIPRETLGIYVGSIVRIG